MDTNKEEWKEAAEGGFPQKNEESRKEDSAAAPRSHRPRIQRPAGERVSVYQKRYAGDSGYNQEERPSYNREQRPYSRPYGNEGAGYQPNENNDYSARRTSSNYQGGEQSSYRPRYSGSSPYDQDSRRPQSDSYRQGGYRSESGSGESRGYGEQRSNYGEQRSSSYGEQRSSNYGEQRNSYGEQRPNNYGERRSNYGEQRSSNYGGGYNQQRNNYGEQRSNYGERNSYNNNRNNYGERSNSYDNRDPYNSYSNNRGGGYSNNPRGGAPRPRYNDNQEGGYNRGDYSGGYNKPSYGSSRPARPGYNPNAKYSIKKQIEYKETHVDPNEPIRLNKYLANAGACSRREADDFIAAGAVKVNGTVITELGTKVKRMDEVLFHDQLISIERKVYVLLNKPKDCVTTLDDPQERKTVMELVKEACKERIYPVGRLDRNTTGVLLLTNDGELASKLTHPKFLKKKVYQVTLDRNVSIEDLNKIAAGVELEDGLIQPDALSYADESSKKKIGIEIHSGKNRIVRRIFESLGYRVLKLDRVLFAGLTKRALRRGEWRYLTEQEVNMLRMGAFE